MSSRERTSATPAQSVAVADGQPNLTNTQLAWVRSDLANLRTMLAWARTSVSMIGFGFTIYNFYRGFLEELSGMGANYGARNLGMALVGAGTVAMLVAVWNYWSINRSLEAMGTEFHVPKELRQRWIYSYILAAVLILIGTITFLFMVRVI